MDADRRTHLEPCLPLPFAAQFHGDFLHVQLLDIPPSICGSWEEPELFLNVWGQIQERQDLSQPRWRDLGLLCES